MEKYISGYIHWGTSTGGPCCDLSKAWQPFMHVVSVVGLGIRQRMHATYTKSRKYYCPNYFPHKLLITGWRANILW